MADNQMATMYKITVRDRNSLIRVNPAIVRLSEFKGTSITARRLALFGRGSLQAMHTVPVNTVAANMAMRLDLYDGAGEPLPAFAKRRLVKMRRQQTSPTRMR